MPASSAASTTAWVPARSSRRPKLLPPRPAAETTRPELPRDLYRTGPPCCRGQEPRSYPGPGAETRGAPVTVLARRQPPRHHVYNGTYLASYSKWKVLDSDAPPERVLAPTEGADPMAPTATTGSAPAAFTRLSTLTIEGQKRNVARARSFVNGILGPRHPAADAAALLVS